MVTNIATQLSGDIGSTESSWFGKALDSTRRAPWLKSEYSSSSWVVSDTNCHERVATLRFEQVLADGRLLTQAPRLYAAVKEYAFFVRDARFSSVDDAYTHVSLVRHLMHVAHALTIRGVDTFKFLTEHDFELLVEQCRFGVDCLTQAPERVAIYLADLEAAGKAPPRYLDANGREVKGFASGKILEACNLPAALKHSQRVSWLIMRAESRAGLRDGGDLPLEMPPLRNLVRDSLVRWLEPIEALWAMRRHIDAEIFEIKPFRPSAAKIAKVKGVAGEKTPIPPPRLAMYLFEQAIVWISTRSEALTASLADAEGQKVRADVVDMTTACWIVIAAFTARRDREIDELTADCLNGDDVGGWWLDIYIEKTLQDKDMIPVPRIVAQAIKVQLAISEEARLKSGNSKIFQWVDGNLKIRHLDVGGKLDAFAAKVRVPHHAPRNEEPKPWHWIPRQMRRFFAVLFFHRYDGATIEAVAHHLRHFNLDMARGYVTQDREANSIWAESEMQYRSDYCRSIVTGERAIGGRMGERFKTAARKIIGQLRRKMQVVTADHAAARLVALMDHEHLILSPRAWVTCSCPMTNDAARRALCRQGERDLAGLVGPDRANEGPITCCKCAFAVFEENRLSYVTEEVNRLTMNVEMNSGHPSLFGELQRENLLQLSAALEESYSLTSTLEPAFALKDTDEAN